MKNQMICAIASSLQIDLTSSGDLEIISIEQNTTIKPTKYSILVLDKSAHTLFSENRFNSENEFDVIAYYNRDVNQPKDIINACKVLDDILLHPGILAHQQIVSLMKLGVLIYNGEERRVKGASYDLLIDKEFLRSGIEVITADTILIDPLDYIVVGAMESANLPKNICGSFDIKVGMFCNGVILSNGPQVDPGYQGRLLCLLFNTSAKPFEIEQRRGFEFSTIQFNALSSSTDIPYIGRYQRKKEIRDYLGKFADKRIADLVKTIPETINMQKTLKSTLDGVNVLVKSNSESIAQINTQVAELQGKTPKKISLIQLFLAIIVTILLAYAAASYFMGGLNQKIKYLESKVSEIQLLIEGKPISKPETEELKRKEENEKNTGLPQRKKSLEVSGK